MLNKQKGQMYGFVTHTWNPIKGICSHDCIYCFMKRFGNLSPLRLVGKELNDDLGSGNYIFVGSSTDMFAFDVQKDWIDKVLCVCRSREYMMNKYLFQTKNPARFLEFMEDMPKDTILGVTIESNINHFSKAPSIKQRVKAIERIKKEYNFPIMITIEPIIDFDFLSFVNLIRRCKPKFVNIGADSKGHNLPEPSGAKIEALINELRKFTEVRIKDNLSRIYKNGKQ